MIVYIILCLLILINILFSHYHKIKDIFIFLKLKINQPKFKIRDKVIIYGCHYEVCDILTYNTPYVYMCFTLNENNSTISKYTRSSYYFYEFELQKMPKVLRGLK